jgi:hypothetical protein
VPVLLSDRQFLPAILTVCKHKLSLVSDSFLFRQLGSVLTAFAVPEAIAALEHVLERVLPSFLPIGCSGGEDVSQAIMRTEGHGAVLSSPPLPSAVPS